MFNSHQITQVKKVIERTEGGIEKRIDENRELLELLYRQCPVLLEKHPQIIGWIDSQERFLIATATAVDIHPNVQNFRKWPEPILDLSNG